MVDEFSEEDPQKSLDDVVAVYDAMTTVERLEVASAFCRDADRNLRRGDIVGFGFCLGRLAVIHATLVADEEKTR